MRTIADSYRDQYYSIGIQEGMQTGIQKGIEQTAIKMIKQNLDLALISSVTGLSSDEILKLKNNS